MMVLASSVKCLLSRKWQYGCPVVFAILLSAGPATADETAKPPTFAVRTAGGTRVRGVCRELKTDWSVRLGEGDGTLVSGDNLLTMRRADVALPPMPVDEHLLLANGDRIPYTRLRLVGETMHLHHPNLAGGKEASLPLAAVAVLWRIAPDKALDAEKLRRRLAAGTRTRNIVGLRNGDVVAGVLTGLDKDKVEVEVGKKRTTVRMAQVAYIAFNTELADALRPKSVYARLILAGTGPGKGGRLSLTSAACADGATLTGTTAFGARLSVPLRDVVALDLHQGRAVYLSDLQSIKYEYFPFLDTTWSFTADGNVAGHDLLLGGSTYDKGVSLHSHGRLTYRLAGAYRRFEALVGLDDRDGRNGSVRVRVLADGAALDVGAGRELTAGSGPLRIGVSVAGVRELTLEVEFGAAPTCKTWWTGSMPAWSSELSEPRPLAGAFPLPHGRGSVSVTMRDSVARNRPVSFFSAVVAPMG